MTTPVVWVLAFFLFLFVRVETTASVFLNMKAAVSFLPSVPAVTQLGSKVTVAASQRASFTLVASSPLTSSLFSSKASFSVQFVQKDAKTAIGVATFQPPQGQYTYLTPDSFGASPPGEVYVTMGGAGFIYPQKKSATRGYKNGDTVKVEVDFAKSEVQFSVNNEAVGSAPFKSGATAAYPVISCEAGPIDMVIT
jgi:hypothetical protein